MNKSIKSVTPTSSQKRWSLGLQTPSQPSHPPQPPHPPKSSNINEEDARAAAEITYMNALQKSSNVQPAIYAWAWVMQSYQTELEDAITNDIILITQFYISSDEERQNEILECLRHNLDNENITKIYLTTEHDYTEDEMNISTHPNKSKIVQINIGKRLKYSTVFDIIEEQKIDGYIILANSDIFLDNDIITVYRCGLATKRKVFCQLRFEYTNKNLDECPIFGPRGDSHDTWIFHSNFNVEKVHRKLFNFQLGVPACDNHINYIFAILGFQVHNEPYLIKTYHNHSTNIRSYNKSTTRVSKPWIRLMPIVHKYVSNWVVPNENWWRFNIGEENNRLRDYIKDKVDNNIPFILPRIAGIENNYAELGMAMAQRQIKQEQLNYIQNGRKTMKNNAGIKLSSMDSVIKYSRLYLSAFDKCDAYFEWEPWGEVYKSISSSHNFININYGEKKQFWAFTLDIFHNIYNIPWTLALKGKRILIISPFVKSFEEKLSIREKIYGIDLFPDCTFVFLKPPQTQGDCPSEEFNMELNKFITEVAKISDQFDVALCSSGGYGNLICSRIFMMGKSAIYVGGVLQMYFGVYGNRWLKERPQILRLFMNKYWSRPKEEEQPSGYTKVEGSCYW